MDGDHGQGGAGGGTDIYGIKYVRGLGLIARQNDDGFAKEEDYEYYMHNAHGDVVQLTDGSGGITRHYEFDAFGAETDPDPDDTNPFRYCGEYFDNETKTYYLRARYFSPRLGRFTTEDPSRDGGNWYVYGNNNPIFFIDPSGLSSFPGYIPPPPPSQPPISKRGGLAWPGQIHNAVEKHVASKHGYMREQTIKYNNGGWGRADLIDPATYQVWEIKRDNPQAIDRGQKQVFNYSQNTWKNDPRPEENNQLTVGGAIEPDTFSFTSGVNTYNVSYRDAGGGVIAYDYTKNTDMEKVGQTVAVAGIVVAAGALAYFSGGSLAPVSAAMIAAAFAFSAGDKDGNLDNDIQRNVQNRVW